jgi:hypothetical protein
MKPIPLTLAAQAARGSPHNRLDALLRHAAQQTQLAYQFAPGSYTFDAMAAVMHAVEARRAADWIEAFNAWNGTDDVLAGPAGKPHPIPPWID